MKNIDSFFYLKNGNQVGPLTFDELINEGINRNTLIWYEGLDEWTELYAIKELQNVVKTLPPPIPISIRKEENEEILNTTKNINLSQKAKNEIDFFPIIIGIIFGLIFFVGFSFIEMNSFSEQEYMDQFISFSLVSFIISLVAAFWASSLASKKSRDKLAWGVFGFFFPPIALISIGLIDGKKPDEEKIPEVSFSNNINTYALKPLKGSQEYIGKYLLDIPSMLKKIRDPNNPKFISYYHIDYQNGFDEIDAKIENRKFSTKINIYSNGIWILVKSGFSEYSIAISFFEIIRYEYSSKDRFIKLVLIGERKIYLNFLNENFENERKFLDYISTITNIPQNSN